jgi:hypothetical protein
MAIVLWAPFVSPQATLEAPVAGRIAIEAAILGGRRSRLGCDRASGPGDRLRRRGRGEPDPDGHLEPVTGRHSAVRLVGRGVMGCGF